MKTLVVPLLAIILSGCQFRNLPIDYPVVIDKSFIFKPSIITDGKVTQNGGFFSVAQLKDLNKKSHSESVVYAVIPQKSITVNEPERRIQPYKAKNDSKKINLLTRKYLSGDVNAAFELAMIKRGMGLYEESEVIMDYAARNGSKQALQESKRH